MTSSVFIDSSLLVEYVKKTQTSLLNAIQGDLEIQLFISQTVISEYLFHHLGVNGGKAPRTLKESGSISNILGLNDPLPFLELFTWLPDDLSMLRPAVEFMSKYNLLPNDALILATCRLHGIPALASFDPDFNLPCQGEGIRLLQTVSDFEEFRKSY